MKYIKQFSIIFLFVFLGELLNCLVPLPIPSSIYGMLLLFVALVTKRIKLEQIEDVAEYLLSIMLIFFVPASVGIMDTFFMYKESMLSIIVIVFISTIVVLSVTGSFSQFIINLKKNERRK